MCRGTNTLEADQPISLKADPANPKPDAPAEPTAPANPDKISAAEPTPQGSKNESPEYGLAPPRRRQPFALLRRTSGLFVYAPFLNPYLTFDSAERSLHGPGGWAWRRKYPRRRRPESPCAIRGGSIFASGGERERRLPYRRFWAHPGDWTELAELLADDARPAQPDWIHIRKVDPRLIVSGRLLIGTEAVRIGANKKLFGWALGIGIALWIAECAAVPFLPNVPNFYALIVYPMMMPLIFGSVGLLVSPTVAFEPGTGRAITTGRLTGSRVYPRPKYDHLEYSARLGNLYQVRAGGKRQLIVVRWAMEPKAWKHFTDQLQEQVQ